MILNYVVLITITIMTYIYNEVWEIKTPLFAHTYYSLFFTYNPLIPSASTGILNSMTILSSVALTFALLISIGMLQ